MQQNELFYFIHARKYQVGLQKALFEFDIVFYDGVTKSFQASFLNPAKAGDLLRQKLLRAIQKCSNFLLFISDILQSQTPRSSRNRCMVHNRLHRQFIKTYTGSATSNYFERVGLSVQGTSSRVDAFCFFLYRKTAKQHNIVPLPTSCN